jgi:outer membrane protein
MFSKWTIGALLAAQGATALGAGDNEIRLGIVDPHPNVSSSGLVPGDPIAAALAPPGAGVDLDGRNTLMLAYTRNIGDAWGLELAIGVPRRQKVAGTGTLGGRTLGTLKQSTPTFIVNRFLSHRTAAWRPYLGAGVAYGMIEGIRVDPTVLPNTVADADRRFGWVVQAGLTYRISDAWRLSAAVAQMRLKHRITLRTDTSQPPLASLGLPPAIATSTVDAKIRNEAFLLFVGYAF